jgi:hypothetical protein
VTAVDAHGLERLRRLERQNAALRRHRAQLERVLAVALRVAVGGTGVQPLELLGVIEEADRRVQEPPLETVINVLKATA